METDLENNVEEEPAEEIIKSSNEILTELFSTFNARPPVIVKTEKLDSDVEENDVQKKDEPKEGKKSKHKKSKKKHKHKEKKKIKKEKLGSESEDSLKKKSKSKHKKRKRDIDAKKEINGELDAEIPAKKIKTEESKEEHVHKNGHRSGSEEGKEKKNKAEIECVEKSELCSESKDNSGSATKSVCSSTINSSSSKIQIKNLKNSTVYEATIREVEKEALKKQEEEQKKRAKYEDGEIESENSSVKSEYDDLDDNELSEGLRSHKKEKKTNHHKGHKHLKHKKSSKSSKEEKDKGSCKHKDRDKRSDRSSSRTKKDDRKDKERKKDDKHSEKSNKDDHSSRYNPFYRSSDRSDRERDRSDRTDRDDHSSRKKDDHYYSTSSRDYSKYSSRDRDRGKRDSRDRDRYRDRSRSRDRDRYRDSDDEYRNSSIDKKKLLEIARKNAINMLKSGSLPGALTLGPQAQEKVIAAIKAGGKTVEELTDFCKTLSRKEELGELSSISGSDGGESDTEKPFHHPFQLKEKPTTIVMNIKNAIPLPTKSLLEKTSELRMLFPVSSGQQHRKTENEWVPVSPKKLDPSAVVPVAPKPVAAPPLPPAAPPKAPLAIEAAPQIPLPPAPELVSTVFPSNLPDKSVDIGSIVSQRLTAMRKLQENPNDVQAISQIYKAQKEMQSWAESKQQPGQFTGSTGVQILSVAELSSGYQAWAKKDQLQNAAPVSGGMGMHLLQKMGWRPGEGLGKEKSGTLEPLLLEVKLDKKGLVANEESNKNKRPQRVKQQTVKTLSGKHPVSLLGEYASKRKVGIPSYDLCFECGPPHKKNFLFKVTLNGIEYKPSVASASKKQAKADAATVCLQQLGILPS